MSHDDIVIAEFGATPRAGDVVLVCWPGRPGQLSIKRAVRPVGSAWRVRGDNAFAPAGAYQREPAVVIAVVRWRLWPRPKRLSPPVVRG